MQHKYDTNITHKSFFDTILKAKTIPKSSPSKNAKHEIVQFRKDSFRFLFLGMRAAIAKGTLQTLMYSACCG